MDSDVNSQPPPPPPSANGGGIMVFYPCTPDQLTTDPRTNHMIMRAISQAGANLSRDSPSTPSGFALMVPNTVVDEYAHSGDLFDSIPDESDTKHLVDKASGGDGPWIGLESKETQWSPGDGGSRFPLFKTGNYIDQTTEKSPNHFQTRFVTDQSTSTTPPKLCDKFTSCSPTPSTTSTYPDSGVDDSKSVSCQDLIAGGETASSSREKRLSSADTLSTEDDAARDDRTVEEDEEDAFLSVNEILGASLIRPVPLYPFVQMADKATSIDEACVEILPLRHVLEEDLDQVRYDLG